MMSLLNIHAGHKFRLPEGLVLCHQVMRAEYCNASGLHCIGNSVYIFLFWESQASDPISTFMSL